MKKTFSIILSAVILLLCTIIPVSASEITASDSGFTNIRFANGYIGFCIDNQKNGAVTGDKFTQAQSTSVADNNVDGSDISQQLKVLFTQCFDELFVPDGNGSYHITNETASQTLQFAIYHFTGEQSYIWGNISTVVNKTKAYTGPSIPDDGYSLKLDNGDIVTFSFMVLEPQNENQQSFFAYKLNVSQEAPHEHDYSDDWESDENEHWHECECEDKTDVGSHSGTTADCVTPSECTICGKNLSDVDKTNHTGETETRNAKPATEFEDGYTGDIHCKGCGELLEKGEVIPATHEHDYSNDWESDENEHWHECECEDKKDLDEHTFTDGVCSVCGKESGNNDPNGDDPNGDDPNGDDPNGDDPNGDDPNGDDPNGDDPNGDDPNGDDPNGDDPNNDDIVDVILGMLGDMNIEVDIDEVTAVLSELVENMDIEKIEEYLSELDSNIDINIVTDYLRDLFADSDKDNAEPESKPGTDGEGATDDSNDDDAQTGTDSDRYTDSESPATGIGTGGTIAVILLAISLVVFAASLKAKKKSRAN